MEEYGNSKKIDCLIASPYKFLLTIFVFCVKVRSFKVDIHNIYIDTDVTRESGAAALVRGDPDEKFSVVPSFTNFINTVLNEAASLERATPGSLPTHRWTSYMLLAISLIAIILYI